MGLMFDFGTVVHGWVTKTSRFCLPCVMGLGFAVMGMGLLNRCLRLGFEWVVGCGSWV